MDYMTSFSGSFYTGSAPGSSSNLPSTFSAPGTSTMATTLPTTPTTTPVPVVSIPTSSVLAPPPPSPSPSSSGSSSSGALDTIKGCFFMWDDYHSEEEEATGEELMLFFYPAHVPPNKRFFLLGGCSALLAFAKSFTSNPVTVLNMEKVKFAVKEEGKMTMALSTDINDPDSAVVDHLDAIYKAFRFFNGSFSLVKERCKESRKLLVEEMNRIGLELLPLICQYQASNPMRAFNLLPYTELPSKTNRYFLAASQILTSIKESDKSNYGGCIIYDNSVVCTHLDTVTTRCILNRIEFMKSMTKKDSSPFDSPIKTKEIDTDDTETDFLPVFLMHSQLQSMNLRTGPITDVDEGEFVGLYIFSLSKLSLAILMSLSALQEKRHIKKMRLLTDAKMYQLERILHKSFGENIPSFRLLNNVRVPHQLGETSPSCYHFLMYDEATEMATGSSAAPVDVRFSLHMSNARNNFKENPAVSQIILRDHKSDIYSRKVFGREIYFQPTGTNSYDLFMDHVEKTVQKSLKNEHNINLL